ncbi:SRPBCC family protein [Ekhidna sp.]
MRRQLLNSIFVCLTFLSAGFLLLYFELVGYGLSFFVFLPFVLGYVVGKSALKTIRLIGLVISLLIFFVLLIIGGLEGMVCVLMALPLVIVAVALGFLIRYLNKPRKQKSSDILKSSLLPFLLFLSLGTIEHKLTEGKEAIVEIESTIELAYTPIQVYDAIKSVDTLIAEKPFLMKLDLPIPHKCILHEERVGGLRTCYFKNGKIVERVTALERGKTLKMDVIEYQLTGRKWFEFKEAIYTFEELKNGGCKMTRITTYSSELYPRFYWQPLEKIGIEQEHEFVFRNLANDLERIHGK